MFEDNLSAALSFFSLGILSSQKECDIDTIFQLLVLTRWLHFASLFTLFGCSLFWLSMDIELKGSLAWSMRATIGVMRLAAWMAAVSGVGWLVISVANMTGSFAEMVDPETIRAFLFETPFGAIAIVRLILLFSLVMIAIVPAGPSRRFRSFVVGSAILMISQAWLGHAAEGGNTSAGAAMIAIYAAHVLSAAAWAGALPALALALVERRRQGRNGYDILIRYSTMATVAVGLVLLSGIANTAFHVGGAVALRTSSYGDVLFAKIALVAAMLVLAATNRFIIMPHLRAAAWLASSVARMRLSLSAELVLATLVLGAAAVLGVTPPPH